MIDIQLLRNDIDAVAQRLSARGYTLDVAGFRALEDQRKKFQTQAESLQAQRNAVSKQIGQAKAKKDEKLAADLLAQAGAFGEQLRQVELQSEEAQAKLREFVSLIPNIPHASVPSGSMARPSRTVMTQRGDSGQPQICATRLCATSVLGCFTILSKANGMPTSAPAAVTRA